RGVERGSVQSTVHPGLSGEVSGKEEAHGLNPWACGFTLPRQSGLAAAAADRGVVHQKAAGAARLQHRADAVAAGLDHLGALAIAAGAGHAHAVLGHVALADRHREVTAANRHAVEHDAAATHAAGQHRAQVLHHAAGHLVLARAGHLEAALALL